MSYNEKDVIKITNAEKIVVKKERIQKHEKRIAELQGFVEKEKKDIEELEASEIKNALKELNVPLADVLALIKEMKK